MLIGIINGPNLQAIGSREVAVYGIKPIEECLGDLSQRYPDVELSYMQSHSEGAIIEELYRLSALPECQGVILNAGGYTHTSVAILDAIRAIPVPVIEVHISNIYARETYRRNSLIAEACRGQITGLGLDSYRLAVEALIGLQNAI